VCHHVYMMTRRQCAILRQHGERRDLAGSERNRRHIDRADTMGTPPWLRRPLARDLWRRSHHKDGAGAVVACVGADEKGHPLSSLLAALARSPGIFLRVIEEAYSPRR